MARKRKREPDSTLPMMSGEFDVARLGIGSRGDFNIFNKYGGTHGFACHKFKCCKYGEKGHVVRDYKKERMCFHYHQPVHLKLDCPAWVVEGVLTPEPIVWQVVKVDP